MTPQKNLLHRLIAHPNLSDTVHLSREYSLFSEDYMAHFDTFIPHIAGLKYGLPIKVSLGYTLDEEDLLVTMYQVTIGENAAQVFIDVDLMVDYLNTSGRESLTCTSTVRKYVEEVLSDTPRIDLTKVYNRRTATGRRIEFVGAYIGDADMCLVVDRLSSYSNVCVYLKNMYLVVEYKF